MREQYVKSFDGSEVYCYTWDEVAFPKGVIQICHGMVEHGKRYDSFAKKLNDEGYVVFCIDERAHGRTTKDTPLGLYLGKDCFEDTVNDQLHVAATFKQMFNLPIYLFGHSYGSFIAETLIEQTNIYDKVILCGSAFFKNSPSVLLGYLISKLNNPNKRANKILKMSFGKYSKKVKTGSWLSTSKQEVDKYTNDAYCGFVPSFKFYKDFFAGLMKLYKKDNVKKIDTTKPIFIVSGSQDPVGNMGKSVKKLANFYSKLGVLTVDMKLYENCRHEIMFEPSCKDVLIQDIVQFIQK